MAEAAERRQQIKLNPVAGWQVVETDSISV
jgi:hypothetical protein